MKPDYHPIQQKLDTLWKESALTVEEKRMLSCLQEALEAGKAENYPVGAVITNSKMDIISQGQNQIFKPKLHSSAHAEMNAIDLAENQTENQGLQSDHFTLFTSLEPCAMCTMRILLSGIKKVIYLSEDPAGGGMSLLPYLPSDFQAFRKRISFVPFSGNPEIKMLGDRLYELGEQLWQTEYQL